MQTQNSSIEVTRAQLEKATELVGDPRAKATITFENTNLEGVVAAVRGERTWLIRKDGEVMQI